jgi:hypothetical protein
MPFRTHSGLEVTQEQDKRDVLQSQQAELSPLNVDDAPRIGPIPGTRVVLTQNIRVYARISDVFQLGEDRGTQWTQIGAIQSLRCSQSRANTVIRGIGYGINVDIAPSVTTYSLSATRFLTYNRNVLEALSYTEERLPNLAKSQNSGTSFGLRSLAQLSIPLEIRRAVIVSSYNGEANLIDPPILDTDSQMMFNTVADTQSVTVYRGCFIRSYGHTVSVGGTTITETVDFSCTRIEKG